MAVICLSHGDMYPHYMVSGHILSQYYHGCTMYWSAAMPWVILNWAWVCLPWGWYTHILSDDFLQLPMRTPFQNDFTPSFCQAFWPWGSFFELILLGAFVTNSFFTSMSVVCECHNCQIQLSHLSQFHLSHSRVTFFTISIVALKIHICHIGKCCVHTPTFNHQREVTCFTLKCHLFPPWMEYPIMFPKVIGRNLSLLGS